MLKSLLVLALVTVVDPVPGPSAIDTLTAPTSAMYRSLAPFDLRQARVLDEEYVSVELELASYANPLELELGFSHAIIEVYLGGGEYGAEALLPGSGMMLPEGESWSVALRLTGDRAWGFEVTADGIREFEPAVTIRDGLMYVDTDVPAIASPRLAAMVGLYSAFHETGWRPLETGEGPWAFSSDTQQVPVVDVLALDMAAQRVALEGGILPVTEVNIIPNPNTLWFALMAGGLVVAGAGLALRSVAGRRARAAAAAAAAEAEAERVAAEESAEHTGEPDVRPVSAALARAMAANRGEAAEVLAGDDDAPVDLPRDEETAVTDEQDTDEPDSEDVEAPRVGFFRGSAADGLQAPPVVAATESTDDVGQDDIDLQSALDELAKALGEPLEHGGATAEGGMPEAEMDAEDGSGDGENADAESESDKSG